MALQVLTDGTEFTVEKFAEHIDNSDIHVTAEEKAAWNEEGIFIAVYGTTTFDELLNAYNSGKTIMAKHNGKIYQLVSADTSSSFVFVLVGKGSEYITYIDCELTGDWHYYTGKQLLPDAGAANNGKALMVEDGEWTAVAPAQALKNLGITYGTDDLTAGTSKLATGALYFVYEE